MKASAAAALLLSSLVAVAQAATYELVPSESHLLVLVYRAGPLSGLGHNHVVAASSMEGEVHLQPGNWDDSEVELRIPVAAFEVDEAHQRAALGAPFSAELSAEAVAATRRNMLAAPVLDAQRHPWIRIRGYPVSGPEPPQRLRLEIEVRGVQQQWEVPLQLKHAEGRLQASGVLKLAQSAFGIEPMRIFFGAVSVRDELEIRFDLVAVRRD